MVLSNFLWHVIAHAVTPTLMLHGTFLLEIEQWANTQSRSHCQFWREKTLRGRTTNMGSKISLLVYEWPLILCKILVYEWVNFSKCPQIWAKIGSKFTTFWGEKRDFAENLGQNWADWYMKGSLFLKKWYLYDLLSNSAATHLYQNQTWVPREITHNLPVSQLWCSHTIRYLRFNKWQHHIPIKHNNGIVFFH